MCYNVAIVATKGVIMKAYSIRDAKNKFCKIIKDVEKSPQEICKNGEPVAVIVSFAEYQSLKRVNAPKKLGDALRGTGLTGLKLNIDRSDYNYRQVDL